MVTISEWMTNLCGRRTFFFPGRWCLSGICSWCKDERVTVIGPAGTNRISDEKRWKSRPRPLHVRPLGLVSKTAPPTTGNSLVKSIYHLTFMIKYMDLTWTRSVCVPVRGLEFSMFISDSVVLMSCGIWDKHVKSQPSCYRVVMHCIVYHLSFCSWTRQSATYCSHLEIASFAGQGRGLEFSGFVMHFEPNSKFS